jgi:hypothetical protein
MALIGGIVLEEAVDLSYDRLLMMMMMMIVTSAYDTSKMNEFNTTG